MAESTRDPNQARNENLRKAREALKKKKELERGGETSEPKDTKRVTFTKLEESSDGIEEEDHTQVHRTRHRNREHTFSDSEISFLGYAYNALSSLTASFAGNFIGTAAGLMLISGLGALIKRVSESYMDSTTGSHKGVMGEEAKVIPLNNPTQPELFYGVSIFK